MPAVLPPARVAVTGANGYIGSHVVDVLLEKGYTVVPVTRDPSNLDKSAHLLRLGETPRKDGGMRVLEAGKRGNLLEEGSFDDAFEGVDAVIHTAANVQMRPKKDGVKEIIAPSHKGTLNVLSSIDKVGTVKRIVHTSSIAAVVRYDQPHEYVFTERDEGTWSSVDNGDFYGVAKLGAERMVREHCEGKAYDCAILNPALVLGPCLCKAHTKATPVFLRQMLFGNKQVNPFLTTVDVRDVAQAHVAALGSEEASGQRFILANVGTEQPLSGLATRVQELFPADKVYVNAFYSPFMVAATRYGPGLALLALAAVMAALQLGPSWAPLPVAVLAALTVAKLRGSEFERSIIPTKILYNAEKSQEILKIEYRPLDTTLKDCINSMRPFIKIKKRATDSRKQG